MILYHLHDEVELKSTHQQICFVLFCFSHFAKYLGVHPDAKLNFNTHVDATTKKANSTRAFVARNFSKCSRIDRRSLRHYIQKTNRWVRHHILGSSCSEEHQKGWVGAEQQCPVCYKHLRPRQQWHPFSTILSGLSFKSRRVQNRLAMMHYRVRFCLVDIDWRYYLTESHRAWLTSMGTVLQHLSSYVPSGIKTLYSSAPNPHRFIKSPQFLIVSSNFWFGVSL